MDKNEILSMGKDIPRGPIEMPPLPEEQPQDIVQEQEQVVEEQPQIDAQEAPQPVQQTAYENPNIRELREKAYRAEMLERELEEYRRREAAKQQTQEPEEDYSINLAPDDLAEGKHLTKVDKKIKKLEDQLRQYQQQTEVMSIESRLKKQYPDFDEVVSNANLQALKSSNPALFETITSSPNLYNMGVSAYTMIKQLNIGGPDGSEQSRIKAQQNSVKPKPTNAISAQGTNSPLSRANAFENGLTDELKAQLIKEMQASRKNL